MTSADITKALYNRFVHQKYCVNNAFVYGWESDFLVWTKTDMHYDIEIKISRGDYFADFKNKKIRHHTLQNSKKEQLQIKGQTISRYNKEGIQKPFASEVHWRNNLCPHRFYFATPKDLIKVKELPDYAGLLELGTNGHISVKKMAPILHKRTCDIAPILLDKFYYRYMDVKMKLDEADRKLELIQQRLYSEVDINSPVFQTDLAF